MIKLEGYLTEEKLYKILCVWAGEENVTKQPMVAGTRMRYDFEVLHKGRKIVVESDGDSHFRDANVIMRDDIKDGLSIKASKEVIRIPYFVQLDKITFKHYFKEDLDITTDFPHGFITTKMLPASFCTIGVLRAEHAIDELPEEVRGAIMLSLEQKAKKLPEAYVYARLAYGEKDGKGLSFDEFVAECRKVHGPRYEHKRNI